MLSDDPASNIKFVEVVEKYPCVYDYKRTDYSKREISEKAWESIAKEVNDTASRCKEKWKNLRTAFSRSMKKPPSGSGVNKKNKEYYLKAAMQFVVPFIKTNYRTESNLGSEILGTQTTEDNSNNSVVNEESCSVVTEENNLIRVSQEDAIVNTSMEQDIPMTKETAPSTKTKQKVTKRFSEEADKCFIEYVKSKKSTASKVIPSDPDLDYFKSLLPDISKMNDYQKRYFKRKTLELIDSILCDGPQRERINSNNFGSVHAFNSQYTSGHSSNSSISLCHAENVMEQQPKDSNNIANTTPFFELESRQMNAINEDNSPQKYFENFIP